MVDSGGVTGYLVSAIAIVFGAAVLLIYSIIWPQLRAWYRRNPWILFPRKSLRRKTLWEESRVNSRIWVLNRSLFLKRSLWTHWSFLWVILFGVPVVVSIAYIITYFGNLPITGAVGTGWQAELTITGLSFIVLIFLLDQVNRTRYREGVIQEFLADSRAMPAIYFALMSSALLAYLHFYWSPDNVAPLVVNTASTAFLGTVLMIGYVYFRVAKLVFSDPLDEMTVEQVKKGVELQLQELDRQDISQEILQAAVPEFVIIGRSQGGRLYTVDELDLKGYISDIDLGALREACISENERFEEHDLELFIDVELGKELNQGVDLVYLVPDEGDRPELSPGFAEKLSQAIYCSPERPWRTGDVLVERNMAQIRESARTAIEELRQAGLEYYLKLYTGLLEYATELNREVLEKYSGTPQPLSRLVNRVFRRFYPILEGVGRTADSELINTVRSEIFRISLMFHQQGETELFDKSVSLYSLFYQALVSSGEDNQNMVHGLLSGFQNLQTLLVASFRDARSRDEADQVVENIESYYDTLEDFLRIALEHGDAQTFNNAWNIGVDAFILVDSEMEIYDLEWALENAESEAEAEKIEEELEYKRYEQETVEKFTSEFEISRYTAAAWAYQTLKQGELPAETFREIFSESIKSRYSSFSALNKSYFRFFEQMRLDFFRWESDEADIFKGVQVSQPAVHGWLKEFYTIMGLILLDPDDFDIDDIDESENPLADLEIDRVTYPGFEESIEQVSEEDLEDVPVPDRVVDELDERKELFLALDEQMEEILERKEEDFIIESGLDSEKVSNYKKNYAEKFEDQFVLRQVFVDLGWLEIELYDEGDDPRQLVFNLPLPRGAFIEEPPTEYVFSVDREAREHINGILEYWLDEGVSQVEVEGHEQLLDAVETVCDKEDEVKAIVISSIRARQALTRIERFDFDFGESDNILGGFETDSGMVPVYTDSSRDFSVLMLTEPDMEPEITEYRKDGKIVDVKLTEITRNLLREERGEDFQNMSEEEIREQLQGIWIQGYYYWLMDWEDGFGTKITVSHG